MTGGGENPLNLHRTRANTRMYQISAETPGNNENTPISNSTVTRGRDLLAFSLIEFVPKASLAAGFSIQKRGKLHVSPAGQQAPGYPRTLLFYSGKVAFSGLGENPLPAQVYFDQRKECVCPWAAGSSDFTGSSDPLGSPPST